MKKFVMHKSKILKSKILEILLCIINGSSKIYPLLTLMQSKIANLNFICIINPMLFYLENKPFSHLLSFLKYLELLFRKSCFPVNHNQQLPSLQSDWKDKLILKINLEIKGCYQSTNLNQKSLKHLLERLLTIL